MYVDFKHIKENIDIEQVVARLGLPMKKAGEQLRGRCPLHDGGERALVVTPSKQLWYCFAPECQSGGDAIELVAKVRRVSTREAAIALQEHFLDAGKKIGSADNAFRPLDCLEADHPAVEALGIPPDVARALHIGYARRGTMIRRVLFLLRDETGRLVGYVGLNPALDPPCKLPSKWHL